MSERRAEAGRVLEFATSWNPRKQDKAAWVAKAREAGAFREVRVGKRVALLDLIVERAWQKQSRPLRLIVEVTERTIDRRGQHTAGAADRPGRLLDETDAAGRGGHRPVSLSRHA